MRELRKRRRVVGAVAILGSLALLASTAIQATVTAPDAYQFNPALTGPQGLRETVAPGLTLAGITAHVALLLAQGGDESRLRAWGRRVAAVGLTFAFVGYAGLFSFDTAIGSLVSLAAALFALLAVGAVGVAGLGIGLYGIALVRTGATADRVAGILFIAAPLVGLVSFWDQIGWSVPTVAYAAGMAVLGYDCWLADEQEPAESATATAE